MHGDNYAKQQVEVLALFLTYGLDMILYTLDNVTDT